MDGCGPCRKNWMTRLAGKTAIITGGCSGIGLASVQHFLAEGARVIVADLQDEKGAALVSESDGRVKYVHCDVSQEADVAATVAAAEPWGGVDIMFNNAGIGGARTGVFDTEVSDWDHTFAVLLRGPMLGIKHGATSMRQHGRGGSIICTASIGGLEAGWSRLPYAVAKAGVIHLCRMAAAELGAHEIRVNAICPGVVVTPIFDVTIGKSREVADQSLDRYHKAAAQMQPLARAGVADDIAKMAVFLGSNESSFITGTHQIVDGGASIGQRNGWDASAITPLVSAIMAGT